MTKYQIQIHGHLDNRWEKKFFGLQISHQYSKDGQPVSILIGEILDQTALYGVISLLKNLGIELISVEPVLKTDEDQSN